MNLNSILLLISFGLLSLSSASAQIMYFATGDNHLFKYNLDTFAIEPKGTLHKIDHSGVTLIDIASDYQGNLFGVGWDTTLFKVDPETALVTPVGTAPTGITAIGMVAKRDGMLYAAGSGPSGSPAIYAIDPITAIATFQYAIGSDPSGDLAYNTHTERFYLSTPGATGSDLLVEINPQATATRPLGATSVVGDFGCSSVFGFDFTGHDEDIVAMCGDGDVVLMKKIGAQWIPQPRNANNPEGCYGGTKYHPANQPSITLLDGSKPPSLYGCGDTPILTGSHSTPNTFRYYWKVSHLNAAGEDEERVEITGDGMPGNLDLKDPRFASLKINHHLENEVRNFKVVLSTWNSDTYEPANTTTYAFSVSPIHLSWSMEPQPWAMNSNGLPQYYYWEPLFLKDTGTSLLKYSSWNIEGNEVSTGTSAQHLWQEQDAGVQAITYVATLSNGCIAEETRSLQILDDNVGIPNAFTPNYDGVNDTFKIQGTGSSLITQIEVSIFDRWGKLVFHREGGTAESVAWDGTLGGSSTENTAVFVYVISYHLADDAAQTRPVVRKGNVTLLR